MDLDEPDDALAEPGAESRGLQGGGPWDSGNAYPDCERVDLGSVQVPVGAGHEVQLFVAENQGAWVTVIRGESGLQVQAFAAPKRSGLWDDVRGEIAGELASGGGASEEASGPFGIELHAQVPAETGNPRSPRQLVRFIGVDGPRWFLRGVISGPAAGRPELAKPLEDVFSDIVVVRGEHPVPPRDLLELRLPAEARQALEEQQAEAEGQGRPPLNPFERGPEITETR
jgi:hypothetical protein